MENIIINPFKEVTPSQYAKFKGVSKQLVNNWLYRDKKLLYRAIPEYDLVLIQLSEEEQTTYKDFLGKSVK